MNKKPLVIISGATATGKSSLSVELALRINGSIISADSMQVYKGLDIGTAKIKKEEMKGVPHYLIDEVEPDADFSVFDYQKRASAYIRKIHEQGKIPVLAGGTGFYIQSVLYDVDFSQISKDNDYEEYLKEILLKEGSTKLHEILREKDPESAALIHENNIKRTIRALTYIHDTGEKISKHNKEQHNKRPAYDHAYFVIDMDRSMIYERVNERVDKMFEEGLLDEVESLLKRGVSLNALSMQGIGYKETAEYLSGAISFDEAVYKIKLNTRHYAKRQLTWFRREKDVIWTEYGDNEFMLKNIMTVLKEKKIV